MHDIGSILLKVVLSTIKPKPNFFFTESDVVVYIWVVSEDNSRSKFSVKVSHDSVTITVIAETIRRRSRISKEHAERCIEEYSDTYALKVCGCDLFL